MSFENIDPTSERILRLLKTNGPQSTAALAESLGVSAEAIRQQVQKLLDEALIAGEPQRGTGAGRPRQLWSLTAAGHARFPDAHAQLAVDLIQSVRALFGEAGVDKLVDARRDDNRRHYLQAIGTARTLADRVRRLAAIREQEGYMARAEKDGRDWLLIEDHCPICSAARACQGFCRAELELFQEVLGEEASVKREQHLLAGARRCVYRISSRRPVGTPVKLG
ncbi:metalloregulator ArsR/SmtB family transcription factor [Dyella sp. BiH032]|uniref:helix-turn-helix transcriptional regulator n=1 Tax=Dyella sp. BiH032 TaxID=3075430 RepID=UPI002892C222|nr:metalloregulator ArsR/SmtB family transcription factor [Dyella sp. BiH032]WNL45199.1 metalloregulator ArsR/SmtB family transcription factor [Dyella sp. BiH032]